MTASAMSENIQAALDWSAVREEFPAAERFVYLDTAKKALLPRAAETATAEWFFDIRENIGARAFSMAEVEAARVDIARVFGMPPDNLALIKNTSEGMNILAHGLGLQPGDNIVISEAEHENNTFPWTYARRRGIEVRVAEPDGRGRVTIERYLPLIDRRTRILSVAWIAYGNGYRADLAALSALCRERDVLLVVDGIQAVGALADPIAELGVDVLVAGGHKAQMSLAGAGIMYVADHVVERITPPYAAKFSFISNDRAQNMPVLAPNARRFEYGNPNFLGVWVQRRSALWIERVGLAAIEARVCELTTLLIELADREGWRVRTPRPWRERGGIVSLDLGVDADRLETALIRRRVKISSKDGFTRVAVHIYNNEADIETFVDATRAALGEIGPG